MLQSRIQRPIPERLSHYTDLNSLKSILSDKEGQGICLWAFSNRHKNDDQEIRMGEYMLKRVRKVLPPSSTMLNQFGGYENSASFSFMEGEINNYMFKKYDHYRLEFDIREIGLGLLTRGLIDCEYVPESKLEEYADEYCEMISSTYKSIPSLQKKFGKLSAPPINNLIGFIQMELDIMGKVFCLKEQQWNQEREWRLVFGLNDNANIHYHNGKPYVEYYLEKKFLTGITVFCTPDTKDNAQKDAEDIRKYIHDRGYKAEVKVEMFE